MAKNAFGSSAQRKIISSDFVHGQNVENGGVQEQINAHDGEDAAENGARDVFAGIANFFAKINHAIPTVDGVENGLKTRASTRPPAAIRMGESSLVADSAATEARWEFPPSAKQAITRITNAAVFIAEVNNCARLPQRTPRHCRIPNANNYGDGDGFLSVAPPSARNNFPLYSPMTMATAASVPQLESQSLQPTINPA